MCGRPHMVAFISCGAGILGAAYRDGRERFSMLERHSVSKALDIFGAEGAQGLSRQALSGDFTHGRHSESSHS
jgi:hypothetical protein